jgi:phage tail-like protein
MAGIASFNDTTQFGLSMRFDVVVGGINLGGWSSCEGLRINFGLKEIRSGGNNEFSGWLPDRINYPHLMLKRAISKSASATIMAWLSTMIDADQGQAATITLRDSHNDEVAHWTVRGVRPFSWTGPTLSATAHDVAVETLELAHEGFL